MGNVIYMDNARIPPKRESYIRKGSRITCTYDPNAPIHQRWVWQIDYVRTYKFYGASPSIESAKRQADKRLDALHGKEQQMEENE